jgi:hypothetical protein
LEIIKLLSGKKNSILIKTFNKKTTPKIIYTNNFSYNKLIELSKAFKTCDSISEIFNLISNNLENKSIKILLSNNNKNIKICFDFNLPNGKTEEIKLTLEEVKGIRSSLEKFSQQLNLLEQKNKILEKQLNYMKSENEKLKNNINKNKNDNNNNINENNNNENNNNNSEDEKDSELEELQKMINTEISSSEDIISKYKQIEDLFYSEMNFYEFIELIFFICRKYYLKQNPNAIFIEMQVPKKEKTKEKQKELNYFKQKEKETFMEIINLIYQEVNEFEKKSKEPTNRGRFIYKFPELNSHRIKMEQIKEKERMREMMRLKHKEIERYNLERKNFQEEDKNVYVEEQPEENDDSSEEDFD